MENQSSDQNNSIQNVEEEIHYVEPPLLGNDITQTQLLEDDLEEESKRHKKGQKKFVKILCGFMIVLLIIGILSDVIPKQKSSKDENPTLIDLTELYESDTVWESTYNDIGNQIDKLVTYKGQLDEEGKLLECLQLDERISQEIQQLSIYAQLKVSLNQSDTEAINKKGKVSKLLNQYIDKSIFIVSHLNQLPKEQLQELVNKKEFEPYKYILEDARDDKIEGLDEDYYSFYLKSYILLQQIDDIYEQIVYVDGGEIENQMDYIKRMRERQYSLAALYNMEVSKQILFANLLEYDDVMSYLIEEQGVEKEVYAVAKEEILKMKPILERYYKLMGRISLEPSKEALDYTKAQGIIQEAYSIFGNEYVEIAKRAFDNNWIDPYPTPYKSAGAFTIGSYKTHPYILANYEENQRGIGTIAHELGHGVHFELARENQPYSSWYPTTFTTEIASLTAEKSVYDYFYKVADNDNLKKEALVYKLECLINNIFYQMRIAYFEESAYKLAESGEALTADKLNKLWEDATKMYLGDVGTIEGEWASIPHIFQDFYTFQYATAAIASERVNTKLNSKDVKMKEDWIAFLRSGNSQEAGELTKDKLGIDLKDRKVYEEVGEQITTYLDELEQLLK
nr:M3 family metallopeptidase [uncultured Niameybacter sp.]